MPNETSDERPRPEEEDSSLVLEPTYSPSREGSTPMPGPPAVLSPRPTSSGFWERSQSGGGGATAHSPSSFVGRRLGDRWEVGPRIGMGGMASVHEGVDHRLGRAVAIKILHPHVAENPDSRARLAREARAIAQLRHENVIEVYDYSIDDPDCTWLVTELIEGASLRQILDRVGKPMPEIGVMIATEVVRALRAAHQTGVVHRDVKPDNILVGKEGRPKLSDFGIAQVMSEQRMTLTGNLVGSPSYMSPEQANGKRTDHRTDLYSTGILLYRLVTGTLPFRGDTALDTIRRVSVGDYVDPVELEPGAAGPIAGIIRRALEPVMDERYQSADELLTDLSAVLQDAGLSQTWEELPKFFSDPNSYQISLRPKLARDLEARGKALLDGGQESRAVDCFNRALSLGIGDQHTLDIVRELSRRRGKGRMKKLIWSVGAALGGIALVSATLVITDRVYRLDAATQPAIEAQKAEPPKSELKRPDQKVEKVEPLLEAPKPVEDPKLAAPAAEESPAVQAPVMKTKRRSAMPSRKAKEHERERPRSMVAAALPPPEAEVPKEPPKHEAPASEQEKPAEAPIRPIFGTLHVGTSMWADILIDGKKEGRAPERNRYPLLPGPHRVQAIQKNCKSEERVVTILAGETIRLKLNVSCP